MKQNKTHTSSVDYVGRLTYQKSAQYLKTLHKKPPENGMPDRQTDGQCDWYMYMPPYSGHKNRCFFYSMQTIPLTGSTFKSAYINEENNCVIFHFDMLDFYKREV